MGRILTVLHKFSFRVNQCVAASVEGCKANTTVYPTATSAKRPFCFIDVATLFLTRDMSSQFIVVANNPKIFGES